MAESVETSGDTVEDAIDEALRLLDATEDEVDIRVLSEGGPNEKARVLAALREIEASRAEDSGREPTQDEINEEADVVEDFLNGLLDRMDVDADVDVVVGPEGITAELDGEDAGLLIGRHGSTIEAIQEVVRTVVKAKTGRWSSVAVDVEGYRARRNEQLVSRARSLAEKAKSSGEAIDMAAMTSSERKLVHQTLAEIPGVRTESQGVGADRHIVIHPA